jgi:hypothetical protein
MKKLLTLLFIFFTIHAFCQQASDIFKNTDIKYYWLGIDYSHVKLIGDFSQFGNAGEKSSSEVKNKYFPSWNNIVLDEREKYDVKGMLRKDYITYETDMMTEINSNTPVEELEAANAVVYTRDDIEKFVKTYNPKIKAGIGIAFIAESLNKAETEAWYHFVAIDLSTNKILIYDRLKGKPGGIGLRNYWAGSIYDVIKDIKNIKYKEWKSKYGKD